MNDKSFSLDTSFVVRLIICEPVALFRVASRFVEERRAAGATLYVGDIVLAEAYFALQTFYQFSKADALLAIAAFTLHGGVVISPVARAVLAMPNLATAKPGFVDRLIHGASQEAGATLVTFEKASAKLPGTLLL